jgi:mannosylglycerate hydrolase
VATTPVDAILVSHTHWDRAWYLPFETFRHRLVRLIDRLIDLLDSDPSFTSFTLDGQTVLLDDYLEIRPQRRTDLERLIRAGRLVVGPWYTAPDLFLPSGESLIRNLQIGLAKSAEMGGGARIGYVPDPFGHPAQMPQIMRGVGIDSYLFMRGMPESLKEEAGALFDWRAPDGSAVLACYMLDGYFAAGGLGLPDVYGRFDGLEPDLDRATEQIRSAVGKLVEIQDAATVLLLNGFDHMPEQPQIPALIERLNAALPDVRLRHGTLVDFVETLKAESDARSTYSGDLLGQADHPILSSVWSTRIYLKQQDAEAERWLARYAEPIVAGLGGVSETDALLEHAWKQLLKNHAHDDICGCSVDAAHLDGETRNRRVKQVAQALVDERLENLMTSGEGGVRASETTALLFLYNPHPFEVRQVVEADVHFPIPGGETGEPLPCTGLRVTSSDASSQVARVLQYEPRMMRNRYLEQTWASRYRIRFEVVLPPCGYHVYHIEMDEQAMPPSSPDPRSTAALTKDGTRLRIEHDGLVLEDRLQRLVLEPLFRFEYVRDAGDTYSFSPVKGDAPRWSRLVSLKRSADEQLDLVYEIDGPASLDSRDEVTLRIDVALRLEPGGSVSIRGRYVNRARDGRLRIVFDTALDVDHALSDGQFVINRHEVRGAETPEDAPDKHAAYPGELTYTTRHQRDFTYVTDGERAVWVANRGLPEYELFRENERASVAVTLHRAVEYLSVTGGRIRRCGAGPHVRVPDAQMQREATFDLALGVSSSDQSSITRAALPHAHPVLVREMPRLPYRSALDSAVRRTSLLRIDDAAIRLSALCPLSEGSFLVRLYNPSLERRHAVLSIGIPATRMSETNLLGTWDDARARSVETGEAVRLEFGPGEIKTLVFRR